MQKMKLSALVAAACLVTSLQVSAQGAVSADSKTEKISSLMANMADPGVATRSAASASGLSVPDMPVTTDGMIVIDAIAAHDANELLADLTAMGMEDATVFGRVVSGFFPVSRIAELENMASLNSAQVSLAASSRGIVTSQGDRAQGSDRARREEGVRGRGVTVGVLSNSYDCLGGAASDIASRDLPKARRINIVEEDPMCPVFPGPATDEGRAMMQIVHDVAPRAKLAFNTANGGIANFAQGIIDLQEIAGSEVIVDDIIYFAEPMFADGIIAQAADQVVANGSAYFSSAGNNGTASYESAFRDGGAVGVFGGIAHDFDPGPDVDTRQSFILEPGTNFIVLQWDQPYASTSPTSPGSASDVDFILYFNGFPFFGGSSFAGNVGGNPTEIIVVGSGGFIEVELGIEVFSGPLPNFVKYVQFSGAQNEFIVDGSTAYGHANAEGAFAAGAAAYFNTAAFNEFCQPACLNGFSARGGVPIFFDTEGNRLPEVSVRQKPELVGPDGVNTTFFGGDAEGDGFPNFFGTSASAPHVAAVAALMIEEEDDITPEGIYAVLEATAQDMNEPGFDFDTGFGFIDAEAAVDNADDFDDILEGDDDDDDDEDDDDDDDDDD